MNGLYEKPHQLPFTHPIQWHVDGATMYNDTEGTVFSWSVCTTRGDAWLTKFFFLLMDTDRMLPETEAEVCQKIRWVHEVLKGGIWPYTNDNDEPWPANSFRAHMAGKSFADGFFGRFAGYKADFKQRVKSHKLFRYYACNFVCGLCIVYAPAVSEFRSHDGLHNLL